MKPRKPTLRGYQRGAVAEILTALRTSQSALLVAPTGSGKTVMFSAASELSGALKIAVGVIRKWFRDDRSIDDRYAAYLARKGSA